MNLITYMTGPETRWLISLLCLFFTCQHCKTLFLNEDFTICGVFSYWLHDSNNFTCQKKTHVHIQCPYSILYLSNLYTWTQIGNATGHTSFLCTHRALHGILLTNAFWYIYKFNNLKLKCLIRNRLRIV